jgi:hypothetical protein
MDTTETRRFQNLHLRHVQGEVLSEADLAFYKATQVVLDTQELAEVQSHQARIEARIQELETELSHLQGQGSQLREQLSHLRQTPRIRLA